MSCTLKAMRAIDFLKPFDSSSAHHCNQEHVLYVQPALLPLGATEDAEHEIWYCMFTTQRFIICKEEEGMITERRELNYRNIKQFKLKKNKRFKKSILPSIKIYIAESTDHHQLRTNYKDEDRPKVVISFKENEERDSFYTKMIEIIGCKKRRRSKCATDTDNVENAENTENEMDKMDKKEYDYDLYNTLDVILYNQQVYNEYLSMIEMEIFPFLNTVKHQCIQMTNMNDARYVFRLNNDDLKHIKAFYRRKPNNIEIRNKRKQWFMDIWCATKLFIHHFPITVSSTIEWIWIHHICRSSIHFMNDAVMNRRCIAVIDILMKSCFCSKYIKPRDALFQPKEYQNLQILHHLIANYVNLKTSHTENLPKLRYKQMVPLLLKNSQNSHNNEYCKYFIDLIHILSINESDIYQCIIQYVECTADGIAFDAIDDDALIAALIQMLTNDRDKKIKKIWPQHSLYLQEIIQNGKEQSNVLKRLKVSLMIDPKLLNKTYSNKYDGMTALECAQNKHMWPKVTEFLQLQLQSNNNDINHIIPGETAAETKEEQQYQYQKEGDRDRDKDKDKDIDRDRGTDRGKASWAFADFVGKCFSFTQLTSNEKQTKQQQQQQQYDVDVQRKLQSYVNTLDKFKAKTRNLEHKISQLNGAIDKQNEKIIELKLENKMLKSVFLNNDNHHEDDNGDTDSDDQKVNKILIQNKEWKSWSYIEIIHWICALHKSRFRKYKNTLFVNLKLRNIQGIHFETMDKSDLTYFYGIVDYDDVSDLYQDIQNLILNT